ncbi:MAG: FHA domain-containing protein [Cyanomargarita calcarea GSE-NOS-MK-12-04C]|jgi:pSer/pThr/pTyr-binding forkhead associated (FHA) protein|uniref:FHA domain-containing protein n=1 Tax=Cyanomargarita calcarea GSE-NOS-MK-12-04C TaxID=2839659 RepID=A0A951QPJ9_9CYAN|nr:FHA domain-containing protein [Cyanomargarita calcarea GSE-NOS-MK-12-04C]
MISEVSEKKMHLVRWLLAVGWLILICSLIYDPISLWLTNPSNLISPFHINSKKNLDLLSCVKVQGVCLEEHPYGIGARIFWAMVLPIGIMILLVFGHEFWRRICPLSFFSQIPRALGIQRKRKIVNLETGSLRYELAGVEEGSWLSRNYLFLQFGLLYLGLNFRILFVNSDRMAMALFFVFTIASAISVGFLFKGKSWCQYFCPMAPVQMFYTGTRGLLGSDAHLKPAQSITQSTCRTIDISGQDKSACVSCQSPCIDIDAERSYWDGITRADQKLVFYGYFGLMLGFFVFYFLYAGNWDYYYSGVWNRELGQLRTLFNPGFYIFNRPIPIPKLIAAPVTLAVFSAAFYFICVALEKAYRNYLKQKNKFLNEEQVLHVCFVVCTFISFNVFFMFGGRSNLDILPNGAIIAINTIIALVSTMWLKRSLGRSKELYSRESLASSLRRQLNKLAVNWSNLLEGRSLQDLNPGEIYVLAKVLPGFNRQDRVGVYKGVLREALEEEGRNESSEVLKGLRQELSVTDEEHYFVLGELGVEDPSLLNPQKQLSRENKLRLESYRRALELPILELVENGTPLQVAIERQQKQILALRQEYAITADEQEQVLAEMFNQDGVLLRTAETLLAGLQDLAVSSQILSNSVPNPQAPVYVLLRKAVLEKEKLVTTQLFRILEMLGDSPEAMNIARSTGILAVNVIGEILRSNEGQLGWQQRLGSRVFGSLRQQNQLTQRISLSTQAPSTHNGVATKPYTLGVPNQLGGKRVSHLGAINDVLIELLQDLDPLVQAASLYALHQSSPLVGIQSAHQVLDTKENKDWLVKETAQRILGQSQHHNKIPIPTLIAQVRAMGRTERRTFQQPTIRVGRGDENDIIILDKRVSRQHAIFYVDRKGVSVKDLGSSNGLRIGSHQIHDQQIQLKQGDIVRFSSGDQLVILVQWEMRSLQEDTITESVGTLEKLFWLYDSSFFQGLRANALIELARNASVRVYHPQQEICKMGTPATELIVLIDGEAMVLPSKIGKDVSISPGQTIGELGVLTHSHYVATVVTGGVKTRTLAIKAAYFEAVLSQDPILAKNLLEIVSTRLQESLGQASAITQI